MRRALWIVLAVVAAGSVSVAPARAADSRFQTVTFRIRHRVFHDFWDQQTVKPNQEFPLGDTEFSARVVRYVPDFQMDLATRRVFSVSDQPRNPAFQVIVRKGKVPQDTTWAFLVSSPPHFGARSYFAFQVVRVDFADRPPLRPDTTRTRRAAARPDSSAR